MARHGRGQGLRFRETRSSAPGWNRYTSLMVALPRPLLPRLLRPGVTACTKAQTPCSPLRESVDIDARRIDVVLSFQLVHQIRNELDVQFPAARPRAPNL